jgi:lysophospholipase L1-like esterase
MLIKSDSTTLTPSDFVRKPDEGIYRIVRADGSLLNFSQSGLSDKKILVFGDSIWGNDRVCGISDYLAEYSGATIYNCAIGGTRITGDRSGQPDWRAFDGENLITAKHTNTWTDQDTYASDVVYYVATETLPLLKSVDLGDIDVLILAYGHNDFASDHTISSIVTAYENVINAILTAYPSIRILVCAPPWRMFSGGDGDTYTNGNGNTIKDMDDALVTMAKSKHIAVLNTLEEVPWSALTASYYLDADSVQPNFEGNKVYAHVVNGKLRNMY